MSKDHDPVRSPSHYNQGKHKCPKCDAGIECITIAQEMPYNLGAAVKYIWRHNDKGNPIQDLEKARQYIQFEIERLSKEPGQPSIVAEHFPPIDWKVEQEAIKAAYTAHGEYNPT